MGGVLLWEVGLRVKVEEGPPLQSLADFPKLLLTKRW